ncbi:hypothetical protein ACVWZA_002439 [Sphingomonas sp. UYAg733]
MPAGKWALDMDPNGCRLGRLFGSGPGRTAIEIRPVPTTGKIGITLALSKAILLRKGDIATVTILPSGAAQDAPVNGLNPWVVSGEQPRFDVVVPRRFLSSSARIESVAVSIGGKQVAAVTTSGLAEALTALLKCETDLLRSWGIDTQAMAKIATPAEALGDGPHAWFPQSSYPRNSNAQGRVRIHFQVGATGAISDCVAAMSSGFDSLDKLSCKLLMKNGKFRPAIGLDGQPVASAQILSVTWARW